MFNSIKIPLAKSRKSKFNLRSNVIATGEMGQLFPLKQFEVVPDDDFTIDVEMFTRTAPLVVPTYGSVKFTTRAFYIPSRLCYPYWNEFITGKYYSELGNLTRPDLPFIAQSDIAGWFANTNNGLTEASTSNFDVEILNDTGAVIGSFKFTEKGRYWLKVLNGLGYKFNFITSSRQFDYSGVGDVKFSALPLIAFLRVYMEFYLPSQYVETSDIKSFLSSYWRTASREEFVANFYRCLDSIQLSYDNDYFINSWKYPMSILGNEMVDAYRFESPIRTIHGDDSYLVTNMQANKSDVSARNDSLQDVARPSSNFAIQLAQRLANYIIRNNYAGSRAVEQILARFGVKVPDMEIQRPVYFGSSFSTLQIMDVTNTAESEYAKLGTYGAKAVSYDGGNKLHIHCKEHGFIILLASIMPETSQGFQGFDRNLLHLNKFDFYTPEFDGALMTPVYSGELLADYKGSDIDTEKYKDWQAYVDYNALPMNLFGFVPYGTEYKVSHDNVIGDFNIPHINRGLDSYHLFREIVPDSDIVAQNPDLVYFNSEQYNRIFNVVDKSVDHFYMIYRVKVTAERPMKSISESIPFNEDDIEHRNRVSMQPNGSSFNN